MRQPGRPRGRPSPFFSLLRGDGTYGYLEFSITTDAGPRRDDIGGDLTPEWGMHVVDANVAMGDLVTLVERRSASLGG